MRNLILAFTLALAQPLAAEVAVCLPIENELDRLACYDREAGRDTQIEVTSSLESNWTVRTDVSDFDDTTSVFMSVYSEDPVRCDSYRAPENIRLILRCMENTTALLLQTQSCHLTSGHGDYGNVEYRVDSASARSREFTESTNSRSLGLWSGRTAIPFIKGLLENEKLLVRFTPFNHSPVTAEFNISGLDAAIAPLREACRW
ncbi:type VI secretion system-associated protein TagO [Halocynthiibacter styelae]|uniref:Type VI secretion system-associated protein TagO n=1 Tax=Halocynthiibacter styelae TaxID=2761955 RepID=A0A8J7IUC8_9RHOB|nr:type VI secretion system-associated protein TagO [Paenihalocynthiibacter styelae]MBI1492528.1 hypothetical protein [Paenihalocynthiibacter styelae]